MSASGGFGPELGRRLRRRLALDLIANLVGVLVALTFLHALHSARDASHGTADAIGGAGAVAAYRVVALLRALGLAVVGEQHVIGVPNWFRPRPP